MLLIGNTHPGALLYPDGGWAFSQYLPEGRRQQTASGLLSLIVAETSKIVSNFIAKVTA